jgi:protein arginine N-methyltransferase 1
MFPLQSHLQMLSDKPRVEAFRRAIAETVKAGDVVADIGTGTGILAFFAAMAGARRVYALEWAPIIDVARRIARDNGVAGRIRFIPAHSMEADLPEAVDLLVTETVGCFAFDEGITAVVEDARRRFLKPNGRIIPQRLLLKALPVYFPRGHPFEFLDRGFGDMNLEHLRNLCANTIFSLRWPDLADARRLAAGQNLADIDLRDCRAVTYPLRLSARFTIACQGRLHGVVVFPHVHLTDKQRIRLFEDETFVPTHWEYTFFPNRRPLPVEAGDLLDLALTVTADNGFVWQFRHRRNGRDRVYSHLSLYGHPSLAHLTRHPSRSNRKTDGE